MVSQEDNKPVSAGTGPFLFTSADIEAEVSKIIASCKAEFDAKIAAFEKMTNGVYEALDTKTLAGLVHLNKQITDLQKLQVLAILQGSKQTLGCFQ